MWESCGIYGWLVARSCYECVLTRSFNGAHVVSLFHSTVFNNYRGISHCCDYTIQHGDHWQDVTMYGT